MAPHHATPTRRQVVMLRHTLKITADLIFSFGGQKGIITLRWKGLGAEAEGSSWPGSHVDASICTPTLRGRATLKCDTEVRRLHTDLHHSKYSV